MEQLFCTSTIHAKVEVRAGESVSAAIHPEAEAYGLQWAMAQDFEFGMARPAGIEPAT